MTADRKNRRGKPPGLVEHLIWLRQNWKSYKVLLAVAALIVLFGWFAQASGIGEDFAKSILDWLRCHHPDISKRPLDCPLN